MTNPARPEPRWEAWRRAEGSIGDPAALEKACRDLPKRQAWILRSIAALDRGDRKEIEELTFLLLEAGQCDLVCVLRLTLLEPEEINPTDVRRRAKGLGIPNGPGLPVLDLIRLFAVSMAGATPTRPPSLARSSYERPVLDALLPVISRAFRLYQEQDNLLPFSRRLAEYWSVAAALRMRRPDVRAHLREVIDDPVASFPERDWPDLGEQSAGLLERWLASPLSQPWSSALDRRIELLGQGGSREVRRRTLGLLLRGIHDILTEGQVADATDPVAAAILLVSHVGGLARSTMLEAQLLHLEMRLDWWRGGPERSAELLGLLWVELRRASPGERRAAALQIVGDVQAIGHLPGSIRGEIMLEYTLAARDLEKDVVPLLIDHWQQIPRRALERATAGFGDRSRAGFLLGMHALASGDLPAALRHAAETLELPGGLEVAGPLALRILQDGFAAVGRPSRRLRRGFESLLDALEDHPPTIQLAALLPPVMTRIFPPEQVAERLLRLSPSLTHALETPRSLGSEEIAEELTLLAALGDEERGRARIRELGRHLRGHADEPSTWTHAVHLAGALSSCRPPRPPVIEKALKGISAFLLHRGPDDLPPVFRCYLGHAPKQARFVSTWVEEHREVLGDDPFWEMLASANDLEGLEELIDCDLCDADLAFELLEAAEEDWCG